MEQLDTCCIKTKSLLTKKKKELLSSDILPDAMSYYRKDFFIYKKEILSSLKSANFVSSYLNSQKKEVFSFSLCGKEYELPIELDALRTRLQDSSQHILSLEDNWDEEGSQAFTDQTFLGVADFLVAYSGYIFNEYHKIIDIPYITPSGDGSIDIDWDTDSYCFLVNIAENGEDAEYYSSDQDRQESKGHFLVHQFKMNLLPLAVKE